MKKSGIQVPQWSFYLGFDCLCRHSGGGCVRKPTLFLCLFACSCHYVSSWWFVFIVFRYVLKRTEVYQLSLNAPHLSCAMRCRVDFHSSPCGCVRQFFFPFSDLPPLFHWFIAVYECQRVSLLMLLSTKSVTTFNRPLHVKVL